MGWDAFVMPGMTFLPSSGSWGTALGIGIGAVVMLIIGMNYHFMMNKYGYTSASAFAAARHVESRKYLVTGVMGIMMSVVFFFYFMSWKAGAMATESYLILALWSILGFVFFLYVFGEDKAKRFGKSTVVWIGLLFLIFFTSLMWIKPCAVEFVEQRL